jgi:hypothetical protein
MTPRAWTMTGALAGLLVSLSYLFAEVAPVPAGMAVCFEAAMCGETELVPTPHHVPSYGVIGQ